MFAKKTGVWILTLLLLFCAVLFNSQEVHAMTVTNVGENKVYKSGSFTVKIKDANYADSSLKITLSKTEVPTFSTVQNKSTTWKVALSGTNNHSAVLTSTTTSTKKDINGEYFIANIGLKYTLKAHSKYVGNSVESTKTPDCRMNFETYDQQGNGDNTAARATHSTSAKTVTLNLQVNTACAAVRTHNQKRYTGCVISFEVARPTYSFKTKHWAQGFSKADLNPALLNTNPASTNTTKNSLVLKQTAVAKTYNCCTNVNVNSAFATTIPRGYKQKDQMYTSAITGTGTTYPLGTTINMGTASQTVSLYYTPISYKITYNLNGGKNNTANPSTYNICYPVTFAAPTKEGSQFLGWYEGNTKITGINAGKSNSVLTTANFYTQMNGRTIGDKTITAKWRQPPTITTPVIDLGDKNKVDPFIKTIDGKQMLVIQKDDAFTAKYYQRTIDEEDGDLSLSDKVEVVKNIPLKNGRATEAGRFEVTYKATNSDGMSATKTMDVLVNDPPKPITEERFFFKDQKVTEENLLAQIRIDDKEDGRTVPTDCKLLSIDGKTDTLKLDTSKEAKHKVKCTVEDSLKSTAEGEFIVNIVEDIQEINSKVKKYPRFIDIKSLSYLEPNSIWVSDPDYYNELASSLEKGGQ